VISGSIEVAMTPAYGSKSSTGLFGHFDQARH